MNKKILLLLALPFLSASLNAFTADKALEEKVTNVLESVKEEQDPKPMPYYGYNPIVFEVRSTFARNESAQVKELNKKLLVGAEPGTPPQTFASPSALRQCYATVVNKEWLITNKSCVIGPAGNANYSFTLDKIVFYRGKYKAEISGEALAKIKYYSDDKFTGATLLNVKSVCLESTPKKATGICMSLWDWILGEVNEPYSIQGNYASIILGNVESKDSNNPNFKLAFTKRSFFTPLLKEMPITVLDVEKSVLKLPKYALEKGNPLPGEPLFHKNAVNEQILVALNTAAAGNPRHYVLFGPTFTRFLQLVAAQNPQSVILTKDLNVNKKI